MCCGSGKPAFRQLQPLKRGGNRRYYRPADMALLETIRAMLHDQGLTIRGAQLAMAGAAEAAARKPRSPAADPVASECAPIDEAAPIAAATVPEAIDLMRTARIRDRLRHALSA